MDNRLRLTNSDFAAALGVSPARASQLAQRGMPRDSIEAAVTWYEANIDPVRALGQRVREQPGHQAGEPAAMPVGGSLAEERAALARAQRERIELQNAVTRGELVPVVALEVVLAKAGAKVAGILDAIPGMLRRRVSTLTAADLALVAAEIAKARNIAAAVTLADLDDAPADDLETDAE